MNKDQNTLKTLKEMTDNINALFKDLETGKVIMSNSQILQYVLKLLTDSIEKNIENNNKESEKIIIRVGMDSFYKQNNFMTYKKSGQDSFEQYIYDTLSKRTKINIYKRIYDDSEHVYTYELIETSYIY